MIVDIFTYTQASEGGAFHVDALIEAAKRGHLDGICVTDRAVSSHARALLEAGKRHGFFVGQGVELETSEGRVVAFPRNIDEEYCREGWRSLGDKPSSRDVLEYFHARGGIVVARDVYHQGAGFKDRIFGLTDSSHRGFDGVDTMAAYRRRIDNELSIEAQLVLKVPACAGSGVFDCIEDIGRCATLFTQKVMGQAAFVEAMRTMAHWACALRDLGEACPMGSPPKTDEDGEGDGRDARRSGHGRNERSARGSGGGDRRGDDRRSGDRRGSSDRGSSRRGDGRRNR